MTATDCQVTSFLRNDRGYGSRLNARLEDARLIVIGQERRRARTNVKPRTPSDFTRGALRSLYPILQATLLYLHMDTMLTQARWTKANYRPTTGLGCLGKSTTYGLTNLFSTPPLCFWQSTFQPVFISKVLKSPTTPENVALDVGGGPHDGNVQVKIFLPVILNNSRLRYSFSNDGYQLSGRRA